mmetsp:Transcript_37082/g.66363  ORF Transcript_37082/g.66363 Transcript_37082/m.66363 type:complete len:126 (+) Transcript_37082:242-619(+)
MGIAFQCLWVERIPFLAGVTFRLGTAMRSKTSCGAVGGDPLLGGGATVNSSDDGGAELGAPILPDSTGLGSTRLSLHELKRRAPSSPARRIAFSVILPRRSRVWCWADSWTQQRQAWPAGLTVTC